MLNGILYSFEEYKKFKEKEKNTWIILMNYGKVCWNIAKAV